MFRKGRQMEKPDLPKELIVEILARLPVKSLISFKRASKSWYALISNPGFVEKHLEFAPVSSEKLVILYVSRNMDPKSLISIHSPNPQAPSDTMAWDVLLPLTIHIVGSSKGLICAEVQSENKDAAGYQRLVEEEFYLCNPATKHLKKLPTCREYRYGFCGGVAFGFDPTSSSHKVVIFKHSIMSRRYSVKCVCVYQEGSDVGWRLNPNAKLSRWIHMDRPYTNVVLNGVVYWRAKKNDSVDISSSVILCFDLGKEAFEVIDLPNFKEHDTFLCMHVMLLGASLGLLIYEDGIADVWVMKDSDDDDDGGGGVKKSWTKLYSAPPFTDKLSNASEVRIGANGEIIVHDYATETKVYAFDVQTRSFKRVVVTSKVSNDFYVRSLHRYVESLVPLTGSGRMVT